MSTSLKSPVAESGAAPTPAPAGLRGRLSALGVRTPRLLRGPRVGTPLDSPTVRTKRLIVRPHQLSDAAAWYEIQSDPDVVRFLSWPLRTRAQSLQHLKDRTSHTRLSQADDLLALAIEHKGRLIGDLSVHLRTVHPDFRAAEIGWILGSKHGGSGLAAEAVRAVITMLFDKLDVKWMYAVVDTQNDKSLALASKLGFTEVHRDGVLLTMILTRAAAAEAKKLKAL